MGSYHDHHQHEALVAITALVLYRRSIWSSSTGVALSVGSLDRDRINMATIPQQTIDHRQQRQSAYYMRVACHSWL